jgi:two-component system sensor histidine kinase BaeS
MLKSLWVKFLVLLFAVSVIALSAALLLRELMVRDFRQYLEGEQEDRVFWITADLEGAYEQDRAWKPEAVRRDAMWALMLGFEMRLFDTDGREVVNTAQAVRSLSPHLRQRLEEISSTRFSNAAGLFVPYPLFFQGREIGRLEVRFFEPGRGAVFIKRSDTFLLAALGALGGVAVVLSIVFSGKLTRPLKKLAVAASAISEGDLSKRVNVPEGGELGMLGDAFNRMAQTLETQEALRKKLISNITHELRTPLAAIRGELEGMMDGLIPADRGQLQSLHDEAGRLKKLLDGMEELARAQASGLTLRRQEFAAKPFLGAIVERAGRAAAEKGISVALVCEETTVVNADPDCLSRIVINLVSNAVNACERGGAVTVTAENSGDGFVLEVKDTGRGIGKENLPFIFERFYRTSPGGLGLGLAIVRELVDAHDGGISVRSEEGKGSVFAVRLPP